MAGLAGPRRSAPAAARARAAAAQTAPHIGLVVAPNNLCLEVGAAFTLATPQGPQPGNRLALAPCTGAPAQRWFVVQGDWNYTRSAGGLCLSYRARALRLDVSEPRHARGAA